MFFLDYFAVGNSSFFVNLLYCFQCSETMKFKSNTLNQTIEMEEYNSEKIIIFEPDLFNRLEKRQPFHLRFHFRRNKNTLSNWSFNVNFETACTVESD